MTLLQFVKIWFGMFSLCFDTWLLYLFKSLPHQLHWLWLFSLSFILSEYLKNPLNQHICQNMSLMKSFSPLSPNIYMNLYSANLILSHSLNSKQVMHSETLLYVISVSCLRPWQIAGIHLWKPEDHNCLILNILNMMKFHTDCTCQHMTLQINPSELKQLSLYELFFILNDNKLSCFWAPILAALNCSDI